MKRSGFSLVEVAISAAVLGTAALLLSATLGTANGQKASARRLGLAKSLAIRQLELMQQRITESTFGFAPTDMRAGPNSQLKLANLRAAGRVYRISHETIEPRPHLFCYRNIAPPNFHNVPLTSSFHVLFPSTVARVNATTLPNPPGSMFADELLRIDSERIQVDLNVAPCVMEGHRDSQFGQTLISANVQTPELIMAQVIVRDTSLGVPGTQMFQLQRMFRVQSFAVFGAEGQF